MVFATMSPGERPLPSVPSEPAVFVMALRDPENSQFFTSPYTFAAMPPILDMTHFTVSVWGVSTATSIVASTVQFSTEPFEVPMSAATFETACEELAERLTVTVAPVTLTFFTIDFSPHPPKSAMFVARSPASARDVRL